MPLLSLITFLPLLGVLFLLLIRGEERTVESNAFWMALWVSLVTLFLAVLAWFSYDRTLGGFQLVEERAWLPALGLYYRLGVDGISLPFVLLSALLTPIVIVASRLVKERARTYMILFLVLETLMIGSFCALDLFLFYIFFEGVLIPMFLIIGIWGGPRRIYATFKFFLYTLAGSLLMLLALLVLRDTQGTSDITWLLENTQVARGLQHWMWLAFFASFAVKIPMWPVHTWLPDAHVEAPTGGSVILAGVLLKLGGYGFLRFSVPMLPEASVDFAPLIFVLSAIAIVYASLVALVQDDMKKMIAYSSVAHMGFVTAGIFTFTREGMEGAIFQMVSHGLISAALFLVVGVVYDRRHSRKISDYGGLVHTMPRYAVLFMVFMLGSVGLPGTSGFIGEFLVIMGSFQANGWLAFFVATGMVLGALYMLSLYRRVIFAAPSHRESAKMPDLSPRELSFFVPLAVLVLLLGVAPTLLTSVSGLTVDLLLESEPLFGLLREAPLADLAQAGASR